MLASPNPEQEIPPHSARRAAARAALSAALSLLLSRPLPLVSSRGSGTAWRSHSALTLSLFALWMAPCLSATLAWAKPGALRQLYALDDRVEEGAAPGADAVDAARSSPDTAIRGDEGTEPALQFALDLDGNGKISKAEKAFVDSDNNRLISREEALKTLSMPSGEASHGEGGTALYSLDFNGDGRVSKGEKNRVDTDHDGAVSQEEFLSTLTMSTEQATRERYSASDPGAYALDLNGEGKVTKVQKAKVDVDYDGALTQKEIMLTLGVSSQSSSHEQSGPGYALDLNRDGTVAKVEKSVLDAGHNGAVSPQKIMTTLERSAQQGLAGRHVTGESTSYALDLNGDGRVTKVEKTIVDSDHDGTVSTQEILSTLGLSGGGPSAQEGRGASGSSKDETNLAAILRRHHVVGPNAQALSAELLHWKAGLPLPGHAAEAVADISAGGSLRAQPSDLAVLGLWANAVDAIDELILSTIFVLALFNVGRWLMSRLCRRRYAQVGQARPSHAPLVGMSLQPSTEHLGMGGNL